MYVAIVCVGLVLPWISFGHTDSAEVPDIENVTRTHTDDMPTLPPPTETRKALYEITPFNRIGIEENNQNARPSESFCQNADFLIKMLNLLIPLLAKNVSGRTKTAHIFQILRELFKSSPEAIQDDEVMYRINDLLETLEKKGFNYNALRITGNTDVDSVISKNNYNFELPSFSNEECTAELLAIIKVLQKAILRLINNPICKAKVHRTRSLADNINSLFLEPTKHIVWKSLLKNDFGKDYFPNVYERSEQFIPVTFESLFGSQSNLDKPTEIKNLDVLYHHNLPSQESPIYWNFQEYLEQNNRPIWSITRQNAMLNPYQYKYRFDSLPFIKTMPTSPRPVYSEFKNQDFLYEESYLSAEDINYPQNIDTYPAKLEYPTTSPLTPYLMDVDSVDYWKNSQYRPWLQYNPSNDNMSAPEVFTRKPDYENLPIYDNIDLEPKYPSQLDVSNIKKHVPDYVPGISDEFAKWHNIYYEDLNVQPKNPQVYNENTNRILSPFKNNLAKDYEFPINPTEDSMKYSQPRYLGSLDIPVTEFEPEFDVISYKEDLQTTQANNLPWYPISNLQQEYPKENINNINSNPNPEVETNNHNIENLLANDLQYYNNWQTVDQTIDSNYPALSIADDEFLTKELTKLNNDLLEVDQNQISQLITTNRPNVIKNSRNYNVANLASYQLNNIDQNILKIIKENTIIIEQKVPLIHQNEIFRQYIKELKKMVNLSNITIQDFASIVNEYEHLIEYLQHLNTSKKILEDLLAMIDVDQLTLQDSPSNVIEFTYLVKRTTPIVYQPYYYVKYRLPYTSFVIKVEQLLKEKPYLESNPSKLYNELTALSHLAETSPDLKKLKKDDILKLTFNQGTLLAAKLVPAEDRDVYKKLDLLKELNSDDSLDDINRLINNARRENSLETNRLSRRDNKYKSDDNKKTEKNTSSENIKKENFGINKTINSGGQNQELSKQANKIENQESLHKIDSTTVKKSENNMQKTSNKDKSLIRENVGNKRAGSMATKNQLKSVETKLLDSTLNAHKFKTLDKAQNSKYAPRNPKYNMNDATKNGKNPKQNVNYFNNNSNLAKTDKNLTKPSFNANVNRAKTNNQKQSVGVKLLEATIDAHSRKKSKTVM